MFSAYTLVKVIHVVAAMIWVGGGLTMTLLNARLGRERDRQVMERFGRQSEFFGRAVFGPSAIVTLLAGVGLVGLSGGQMAFWTAWGLVAVVGSIALGAVLTRRTAVELATVSASPGGASARVEV